MANFEAKITIKQGKNAKRTNGTHFTRVLPPPPKKFLLDSDIPTGAAALHMLQMDSTCVRDGVIHMQIKGAWCAHYRNSETVQSSTQQVVLHAPHRRAGGSLGVGGRGRGLEGQNVPYPKCM